jgi:hypothetical protein
MTSDQLTMSSPESKHIGTLGISSFLGHVYELLTVLSYSIQILMPFYRLDEGFKGSSYLTETLLDPELGHSFEPNKTPFNSALNFEREM